MMCCAFIALDDAMMLMMMMMMIVKLALTYKPGRKPRQFLRKLRTSVVCNPLFRFFWALFLLAFNVVAMQQGIPFS